MIASQGKSLQNPLRREWPLAVALVTLAGAFFGKAWLAAALAQPVLNMVWLALLCGLI